jgi:hypothetical protein
MTNKNCKEVWRGERTIELSTVLATLFDDVKSLNKK